jgi:hypothetical protein
MRYILIMVTLASCFLFWVTSILPLGLTQIKADVVKHPESAYGYQITGYGAFVGIPTIIFLAFIMVFVISRSTDRQKRGI